MHHICILKNNGKGLLLLLCGTGGWTWPGSSVHIHITLVFPYTEVLPSAQNPPNSSKALGLVVKGPGCGPRKAYVQIPHMYADLLCGLLQVTRQGTWG